MSAPELPDRSLMLLAIASAIVTANAYYVHPIIGPIAEDLGVGAGLVGAVPALNQIGLALGICLLLPLGDRLSSRRLVPLFLGAQTLALAVMALAGTFVPFVIASTVLGFFTITPYLLPAYVSKRVGPTRLGHATAMLTTGVIAGVLLSRTVSGAVGEYFGWRTIYFLAAGLMALATLVLPLLMDDEVDPNAAADAEPLPYGELLASLLPLVRAHPAILVSGAIQALNFGIFLSVWLGIGLHLTSPALGYGTDAVGFLAVFAVVNLFTTPRLGRWADRVGPLRARFVVSLGQFAGVLCLYFMDATYWWLLLPITLMNVSGPLVDITGRMTALQQTAAIRTRLLTVYIILMFTGAGAASWAGTLAYELGGWHGTCALATVMSVLVVALSGRAARADAGAGKLSGDAQQEAP
ncbi:MAG: MFS transporter [Pseudomonadales bacterium]|jgi:predicted MFS family arabinose efflux permease|nr:MFS transporter [Pseudomonadales bacterium]